MMSSTNTNRFWFWLVCYASGLFFAIIVSPLLKAGMLFDGVIYAALAKNLSLGLTTIWHPVMSLSMLNPFYEHPPLGIYFQSLFFKIFGQGFATERIYILVLILGQFGLLSWYWLKNQAASARSLGLLLLLWLLIPINLMYIKNYLIATLTLFTTMASLILLIKTQSKLTQFLKYLASSILVLIAFLSDGPVAFFPLAIPLIYRIVYNPSSIFTGILETLFFLIMLALIFFGFYQLFPEALYNTQQFLHQQVIDSVMGTRSQQTAGIKHLFVLFLYFKGYALVSLFAIACIIIAAKIDKQPIFNAIKNRLRDKNFLLFWLISLASSLPVGISGRQGLRYLMASAPFFTLAMMWLCFQPFEKIVHHYANKPLRPPYQNKMLHLFFASLIAIISINNLVSYYRSDVPAVIKDVHTITRYCAQNEYCSKHAILSINDGAVLWASSFYLARYATNMISITLEPDFPYFLGFKKDPVPAGYRPIDIPLTVFNLAIQDAPLKHPKTTVAKPIQAF